MQDTAQNTAPPLWMSPNQQLGQMWQLKGSNSSLHQPLNSEVMSLLQRQNTMHHQQSSLSSLLPSSLGLFAIPPSASLHSNCNSSSSSSSSTPITATFNNSTSTTPLLKLKTEFSINSSKRNKNTTHSEFGGSANKKKKCEQGTAHMDVVAEAFLVAAGASKQDASANGSGEDDEDDEADRLTKRRSQIAAASRKSRAKRKHELTTLREANEELEKENEWLRMRLSALGEPTTGANARPSAPTTIAGSGRRRKRARSTAPYDDLVNDDNSNRIKNTRTSYDHPRNHSGETSADGLGSAQVSSVVADENDTSTSVSGTTSPVASSSRNMFESEGSTLRSLKRKLLEISGKTRNGDGGDAPVVVEIDEHAMEGSEEDLLKGLVVFKSFFKTRLSRFFGELKNDTLMHFGDELQSQAKKQLASLQLLVRQPSPM